MLFVDEFCGIYIYIKFGADVTSQYDGDIMRIGLQWMRVERQLWRMCGNKRASFWRFLHDSGVRQ